MYNYYFEKYLQSDEYLKIEYDTTYTRLRSVLKDNLPFEIFLDAEELLHEEIVIKMEHSFKAGYNCGTK